MIKAYGEHLGCYYEKKGFCIYNLAIRYDVTIYDEKHSLYVHNMKELKQEISKLLGVDHDEES